MSTYRILVTGSRDWDDWGSVVRALTAEIDRGKRQADKVVLVHGGCPTGADEMADATGRSQGIEVEVHKADWNGFGKGAGPRRNAEMVQAGADKCLAFIKDSSPGATGCVALAQGARIPTEVWRNGVHLKAYRA